MLAANLIVPCAYGDVPISTLISFSTSSGTQPAAGLVQGPDGALYGTTEAYGPNNKGTVFKIASDGIFTNLVSFTGTNGLYPGANPAGTLLWGTDGNFYGTTSTGGTNNNGTVFQLNTNGVFTSLVSFTGTNGAYLGEYPVAGLVWGTNGNLYGTTQYGGTNDLVNGSGGTIFELTTNGVFTSLVSFTGTNGAYLGASPNAALTLGTDGNFYGTTEMGGTNDFVNGGDGTVFRITSTGAFTTLVSFNSGNNIDGANPYAGLIQGLDGYFYGTTYAGGSQSLGTIFKITSQGLLTTLLAFNSTNGASPEGGLVQGLDGDFYGTTQSGGTTDYGTVFQMTPVGMFTSLVSFAQTNGANPVAGLIQGSDGYFYGTTGSGGTNFLYGTVFRFPPPPNILSWKWAGGALSVTWSAAAGQTYQVLFKTNLDQTAWTSLATNTATSSTATNSDTIGTGQQRFYRVSLP